MFKTLSCRNLESNPSLIQISTKSVKAFKNKDNKENSEVELEFNI
jgi:hypothetical protein